MTKRNDLYILSLVLLYSFAAHAGKSRTLDILYKPIEKVSHKQRTSDYGAVKYKHNKTHNNIIDLTLSDNSTLTPHEALMQEQRDYFYTLFQKDPEKYLNTQDANGNTLLSLAIQNKLIAPTVFLMQHGADWYIKNKSELTAHDYMTPEMEAKIQQALHWTNEFFGFAMGLQALQAYEIKQTRPQKHIIKKKS